jgi:MFS family permease
MTAVISASTLAAPLGFLIAGQVLERWGVLPLFTAVVLGITWISIVFAAIAWRQGDVVAEPLPALSVAQS